MNVLNFEFFGGPVNVFAPVRTMLQSLDYFTADDWDDCDDGAFYEQLPNWREVKSPFVSGLAYCI